MGKISRETFLNRFQNRGIDTKKVELDQNISASVRSKFRAADTNGDGVVKGHAELSKLFTELDHFDSNGDRNSIALGTTSAPNALGKVFKGIENAAFAVAVSSRPRPISNNLLGRKISERALVEANSRNTIGRCYAAVADVVDATVGRFLWGGSAYQAADQLSRHPSFKEIEVGAEGLRGLPAGCVVVWGKTTASPHGHISIALGDGREASDHVDTQRTHLRGHHNFRVFRPV